jgi:hypothetical protein
MKSAPSGGSGPCAARQAWGPSFIVKPAAAPPAGDPGFRAGRSPARSSAGHGWQS